MITNMIFNRKNSSSKAHDLGLALSGGGARGFAHLGVFKALDERGIRPDIIAGVSAGAIAAVIYAAGINIEDFFKLFESNKFTNFVDFNVPRDGFLKMNPFINMLRKLIPYDNIEDLPVKTVICATDFDHGTTKMFDSGPIAERVAASCSIPIIFKPVKIDGINYVDGGVLRNLPSWAIRDKCMKLIGVNCSPFVNYKYKPNIIDIAQRSYDLMSKVNTVSDIKMCDTLIMTREIAMHKALSLKGIRDIYQSGYADACRVLDSNEKIDITEFIKSHVLQ